MYWRLTRSEFERRKGAGNKSAFRTLVEGYPVEPRAAVMPDAFAWTGIASAFRAAGFRECARRSRTRPIMRRAVRAVGGGTWAT